MAIKKTMFDFYQCKVASSQSDSQQMSVESVFELIKNSENRVKDIGKKSFEVRFIEKLDYGYRGIIGQHRESNLPHAAIPNGGEREIDLRENEKLLEKCFFVYYFENDLLIMQRNRYAVTHTYFSRYLTNGSSTVSINPIIEAADLKRMMRNDVNIRTLKIVIAKPTNLDLFKESGHDFNNSIIQSLGSSNAASINIGLRGDARSNNPEKRYLDPKLKRALLELQEKLDVKKAEILLEEGDVSHPIDLVADRLVCEVDVEIEGRYFQPLNMWDAISEAKELKNQELSNYFGIIGSTKIEKR